MTLIDIIEKPELTPEFVALFYHVRHRLVKNSDRPELVDRVFEELETALMGKRKGAGPPERPRLGPPGPSGKLSDMVGQLKRKLDEQEVGEERAPFTLDDMEAL